MGGRICDYDWAATELGPAGAWSSNLCVTLGLMLRLPEPALLLWGSQLVQFFNDPCQRLLGDAATDMLGQPFARHWPEAGELVPSIYDTLLERNGQKFSIS